MAKLRIPIALGLVMALGTLTVPVLEADDQRFPRGRRADQPQRVQGQLQVGQMAMDFTLEPRDGGDPVTLSSFRGTSPVALVFGSYT